MYHHIEGELVVLAPARAVVDAGGVGYECRIPLSTFGALKGKERTRVRLMTHLQVLEDDLRLFGFATEKERDLFRLATSISGVGPAIALAALASFDPPAFAAAIASGDSKALQKIKGVGPKLSERMILELKDRAAALATLSDGASSRAAPGRGGVPDAVLADAVALLLELGYSRREATARVDAALERLLAERERDGGGGGTAPGEARAAITVEALAKAALRSRD